MARINIEDSLYRDDRFLELVAKTGDIYKAKGLILTAFTLAQKYWLTHKAIPKEAWPESLNILIECGLAEMARTKLEPGSNGGSIYVRGSREQFAWIERNAKAGRSKSKKKTQFLKNQKPQIENNEVSLEPGSNQTEPLTLTPTPTLSLSLKENVDDFNAHEKEIKKIEKFCYEKSYLREFMRHSVAIKKHFDTLENFVDFCQTKGDAFMQKKFDRPMTPQEVRKAAESYIGKAIKGAVGIA